MGRKVLISFLGTGPIEKGTNQREYRTANYHIDDTEYVRTFVADALTEHYGIDTVFMIGTVKSMWEELYRVFCAKRGAEIDEEYYLRLGSISETASSKSKLELPDKEKIEEVLGKDSRIVLINYGLNEEEINNNISAILSLEKDLRNGDELYVDITHSFRSLPLLVMNTLIYLQNVSGKAIQIKKISYGMLDIKREIGYVPVVDLKKVLEVNDWIVGAFSFSEYGNAYKIAHLLQDIDKDAAKRLTDFSNACNINNMLALQKSTSQLSGIKLDKLPPIAQMTVAPVVKEFIKTIGKFESTSEFQYKLAKWHRDKHNYYAAYLTLIEAIVSYACEQCYFNETDKDNRDEAKKLIVTNQKFDYLKPIYRQVNNIRAHLAHAMEIRENNDQIKKVLNEAIDELKEVILH